MGVGHEVRDIENKLTLMDGRLCYSNRGIHLLCNVLATSLLQGTSENNLPPEWMELRRFTSNNAEYIGAIEGGSDDASLLKDGSAAAQEKGSGKKGLIDSIAKNATPSIRESVDASNNMNFGSPLINSLLRTPSNESAGAAIHKSRSSRRRRSLGI